RRDGSGEARGAWRLSVEAAHHGHFSGEAAVEQREIRRLRVIAARRVAARHAYRHRRINAAGGEVRVAGVENGCEVREHGTLRPEWIDRRRIVALDRSTQRI